MLTAASDPTNVGGRLATNDQVRPPSRVATTVVHRPVEQGETPSTKPEFADTKVTDAGWKPESFDPDGETAGDPDGETTGEPRVLETAPVDVEGEFADAVGRLDADCCGVRVVLEQAAAATATQMMNTLFRATIAGPMMPPNSVSAYCRIDDA